MKEKKTSTDSTWERLKQTLSSRGIVFTAASTLITHVVYIGFLTIFPAFLYNIVGLDLAKSAGLSAVFTITGMMGQIIWPTLSDKIGRRLTLILCGCWMAVSIASFCLISGVVSVIAIQLFLDYLPTQFGLFSMRQHQIMHQPEQLELQIV